MSSLENSKTVIFTHMPKTAGTTLKRITQYQYKPKEFFEFYSLTKKPTKGIDVFRNLPESRKQDIKFVTGHMGYGIHQYIPSECQYITVLRDPIKRVISFYFYLLEKNPNHVAVRGKTLEEYVLNAEIARNDMTKYLSSAKFSTQLAYKGKPNSEVSFECTTKTLEEAKFNLSNAYTVVGTVESFNATLVLLKHKLGWDIPVYSRANVAKSKAKPEISDSVLERLHEINRFDIELYEYAAKLFEQEVAAQGRTFQKEVEHFEAQIEENKLNLSYTMNSFCNRVSHKANQLVRNY